MTTRRLSAQYPNAALETLNARADRARACGLPIAASLFAAQMLAILNESRGLVRHPAAWRVIAEQHLAA